MQTTPSHGPAMPRRKCGAMEALHRLLEDYPDFRLTLVLLCHFLIHRRPLLPQTAGTSGQRFDQSDGKLTADACD